MQDIRSYDNLRNLHEVVINSFDLSTPRELQIKTIKKFKEINEDYINKCRVRIRELKKESSETTKKCIDDICKINNALDNEELIEELMTKYKKNMNICHRVSYVTSKMYTYINIDRVYKRRLMALDN